MNRSMIILWLTIFLELTKAQHEILQCTIKDGEIEIHLELKRTEQLLANEHLPVWTARARKRIHDDRRDHSSHEFRPDIMTNQVGEFVFYHDKEKSSAVVLFKRSNTMLGVIDTRYVIDGLPLHECGSVVEVGGLYVRRIECPFMNVESHLKALDLSIRRNEQSSTRHDERPRLVNDDSVTILYPEIMVFVPYDKTRVAKLQHSNSYLSILVAQQLLFFNNIDLLISKLSSDNIKIHLNLAGIVIEDQENAFGFMGHHHEYRGIPYLDTDQVFNFFSDYGVLNRHIFPQDSFDFFFIPTRNLLWSSQCGGRVDGLAKWSNSYIERRDRKIPRFWPGATVRFESGFEYIVASHEIAHLLHIGHDPVDKGFCGKKFQCYAIMQGVNSYCLDCLKWSDESYEDLEKFVRNNRDHCYLLNKPRSLYPHNSRIRTLAPSEQCRCYGYEPLIPIIENEAQDVIPRGNCGRSLKCGGSAEGLVLPLPIDGTPCSKNGLCWDKKCRVNDNIVP